MANRTVRHVPMSMYCTLSVRTRAGMYVMRLSLVHFEARRLATPRGGFGEERGAASWSNDVAAVSSVPF